MDAQDVMAEQLLGSSSGEERVQCCGYQCSVIPFHKKMCFLKLERKKKKKVGVDTLLEKLQESR